MSDPIPVSLPVQTGKHKDYEGAKLGMWLFLFTEIVLFGGLFILYSVYRSVYPADFHEGGRHLNAAIGIANTVILLTSSLTMALSIAAIQRGNRKLSVGCLSVTIVFGAVFLINKYIEWSGEIQKGFFPDLPELLAQSHGIQLFFGLYYSVTGLHGLHILAGIILLTVMLIWLVRGKISQSDFNRLENSGLYWHLVDVIWIFLLPLFYLAA
ncbi:MAG: cytochrome c oxidase subunit 3 family protein [Acidobacteria bacterium]|nr:cytochrome c oxidase subunit 3 family protein [Acidobacteriota bacterium]